MADQLSFIKRDFMGAPIERALKAFKDGKSDESLNCEIPYRKNEKYWIRAQKDKVEFIYSVNFNNKTDIALAKTVL